MNYDGYISTDPADLEPDWDGTRDEKGAEIAEDKVYQWDQRIMAHIFRETRESQPLWKVLRSLSDTLKANDQTIADAHVSPEDQWAADFHDKYGDKAILAALVSVVPAKETR